MVSQRMAMQVIDKKTYSCIPFHPSEHFNKFMIFEVVTEQGRENNIRLCLKLNFSIIAHQESNGLLPACIFRHPDTIGIYINTREMESLIFLSRLLLNDFQIISAAAAYFTNM